jgi:hypothetical protein
MTVEWLGMQWLLTIMQIWYWRIFEYWDYQNDLVNDFKRKCYLKVEMAQYAFFKAPEWDSDFFLYSIRCIIKYISFILIIFIQFDVFYFWQDN